MWKRGPLPPDVFGQGACITSATKHKKGVPHFCQFFGEMGAEIVSDDEDCARVIPPGKIDWYYLIPNPPGG